MSETKSSAKATSEPNAGDDAVNETISSDEAVPKINTSDAALHESPAKQNSATPLIVILAWIVPGLGHLLLRRRGPAIIFFIAVGGLAITGYFLRGNVFPSRWTDAFGALGFFADASSGIFYVLARFFESTGADVSRAAGDYGTRFIAAAGVVNLISICDAYEIASGRRS